MGDTLTLVPIQVIEQEGGVVLRRGQTQVLLTSAAALPVIEVIQKALLLRALTRDELLGLFAAPIHPLVSSLLDVLEKKHLLLRRKECPNDGDFSLETPQEIFYWHFNQFQSSVASRLNETGWVFVGINRLTGQLVRAMQREGLRNYRIVDDAALRNVDFFGPDHRLRDSFWLEEVSRIVGADDVLGGGAADIGFVVAASEFGSMFLLEKWNEYAISHDKIFYPVLLQNMVGYAGPLAIPGDTACLACLKARQNSTSSDFEERRRLEVHATAGQKVVAYHQSMLSMLAAVAEFDLVKFRMSIQWEVGTLGEIDLLGGTMTRRKVLKAPRCPVCSGLRSHSLINIRRQVTSDADWAQIRQTVGPHGE